MRNNVIREKSFAFAIHSINLFKKLQEEKKEYILSKQLLRSGTSIGACVREGINAESRADFIHKLGIAQKECDESIYWIELLHATHYLTDDEMNSIIADADEMLRIIRSIIITTKRNYKL